MLGRRSRLTRLAAGAFALGVTAALAPTTGAGAVAPPTEVRQGPYVADIAYTAYGIPHITADDIGSLGFGNGWAAARDNLCIIADTVVTTDAERSRWFGVNEANVVSDTYNGWVRQSGTVEALLANGPEDSPPGPSAEAREHVAGFAAGYNQYLHDVGGADGITDPRCSGADWVREITPLDVWNRAYLSVLRASTGALAAGVVAAQPPAPSAPAPESTVSPEQAAAAVQALAPSDGLGSNAYGLGSQSTVSGAGMVLGNPHFPWDGPDRFWQSHLTIPGELDVQGVALIGTPGVQIGFTQGVAWSHTVSTAQRFALRALQLVPGEPTHYVVDGETLQMTSTEVAVPGGPTQTVWETVFGPVVVLPSAGLTWSNTTAFAIEDANETNLRTLDQWNAMNRAQSVEELIAAMEQWQGIPWVNTTGADSTGTAVYAQLSAAIGVPDALAEQCIPTPELRALWQASGLAVLAGNTHACDPVTQEDAVVPGILGPSALPVLTTDTYVTQSNDSHWLSNPDQPLEGFARVIGDERTPRSLRTRLGILQVEQRLAGTDGLPGTGFTVERLQHVMFGNRHYGGELVADALIELCTTAGTATTSEGVEVDLTAACAALAGWDRRVDLRSTGSHLFREFARAGGLIFAVPFDVNDPVNTPNTLDVANPAVLTALADAVALLNAAGIPLDAPLGTLQSEDRNGVAIPLHGGLGPNGVFNVLNAAFQGPEGYPDVTGNSASFLMTVEMLPESGPRGATLLTYSQSSDPTSPHYGDQTQLYSEKQWVPIRWTPTEVAGGTLERVRLVQNPVPPPDFRAAACVPDQIPASPFTDVTGDSDLAVAVRCLAAHDITRGTAGGSYAPSGTVSRAQMVLFLARYVAAAGGTLPAGGVEEFSDAELLSPEVAEALGALAAVDVVRGRPDGQGGVEFDPTGQVSRGQMAAFLVRLERFLRNDPAAFTPPVGWEDRFTDDDGTFAADIQALATTGVAQGTTATTFSPSQPVSRGQMALFLARLLQLDEVPPPISPV